MLKVFSQESLNLARDFHLHRIAGASIPPPLIDEVMEILVAFWLENKKRSRLHHTLLHDIQEISS